MAVKSLNFKMNEEEICAMKEVAQVFNMSVTDLVRNGVNQYIEELKKDPYYRLAVNVQDADEAETSEILSEIEGLSDEDLKISSSKKLLL